MGKHALRTPSSLQMPSQNPAGEASRRRRPSTTAATKRKSYRAARSFFLTLAIAGLLATYAYTTHHPYDEDHLSLSTRDLAVEPQRSADEQCRLVHHAPSHKQCAFIHANCPDDEPGFSAYLDLYYCQLPKSKPFGFFLLVAWLGILFSTIGIAASDFFCINLSTLAGILGMSESMAGVTFLAFGNGSPDVFSTFAAMSTDSGSLAVGELIGAAGFITAVVAGSMALIRPFKVSRKAFIRDVGFFVVAAAFSMVFLSDGKLRLWECLAMVAYYVFYVTFVVVWHWWLARKRRRREKELAARGQYAQPGDELETEQESYHDDPEEAPRPGMSRGASADDFFALERNLGSGRATPYLAQSPDEDEEEEERDRWIADLNSNMRLSRPLAGSRRNTVTRVRPSLVGALEFQSVLKSLQKSRNIQTIPMHSRRYSDDPTYTQADQMSTHSDPAERPSYEVSGTDPPSSLAVPTIASARTRAVSANGAAGLRIDQDLMRRGHQARSASVEPSVRVGQPQPQSLLDIPPQGEQHATSPTLELSPASPKLGPAPELLTPPQPASSDQGHLAVPEPFPDFTSLDDQHLTPTSPVGERLHHSPSGSPSEVPRSRTLPRIVIPRGRSRSSSRSGSPLPSPHPYMQSPLHSRPPSLYLPEAMASPESLPTIQQRDEDVTVSKPTRWWPYNVLPPPGVIISTLCPTIYHWSDKSIWEKLLGVVAAPSVFLLTTTLPVVEKDEDNDEDAEQDVQGTSYDSARSKSVGPQPSLPLENALDAKSPISPIDHRPGSHHHGSIANLGPQHVGGSAAVAMYTEQHDRNNFGASAHARRSNPSIPSISLDTQNLHDSPSPLPNEPLLRSNSAPAAATDPTPQPWNRWLTLLHIYTAPLFILLSIYSQSSPDSSPRWLLLPFLICLLGSTVLLVPFLLTTTPLHRPPIYRTILSLAGFTVSIAWISTIAAQVVGALKALAVILNISHAIMGLTIFAVGNSLGDLVADITVARLGYPVMALSACFGGPMLNILLGIGLSGSWILIRGHEHRQHKHPGKEVGFKSYHIEVEKTLVVSGITLLVTLVGLLVVVPLNGWVLSRRIGWVLIAIWVVSTVCNVGLEVSGVSGGHEDH